LEAERNTECVERFYQLFIRSTVGCSSDRELLGPNLRTPMRAAPPMDIETDMPLEVTTVNSLTR